MTMLGGFVPLVLHAPDQRDEQLAEAERIAANMAAAGGRYFVTAPVPSLADWHRPELDDAAWAELLANIDRVAAACERHGLVQVVHPHVDTDIENVADFERFLAGCESKFCFDTGHLTIGGADVVAIARRNIERIGLVHLKDVDPGVADLLRADELTLMEATQAGLFPPLGDGCVPIGEVVAALEQVGYAGWYVIETDVALGGAPPPGEGPVLGVARSLSFLRTLAEATA
jgi:inosose dehydratase